MCLTKRSLDLSETKTKQKTIKSLKNTMISVPQKNQFFDPSATKTQKLLNPRKNTDICSTKKSIF